MKAKNIGLAADPILTTALTATPDLAASAIGQFLQPGQPYWDLSDAMIAAYKLDPSKYAAEVRNIAQDHPVNQIRVLPSVLDETVKLDQSNWGKIGSVHPRYFTALKAENVKSGACEIKAIDHRERVNEVPFFDWSKIVDRPHYAANKYVETAWPLIKGWLLGFDKGEWGGGLLFLSHDMNTQKWLLQDHNVIAIIPFAPPAGQLYANQYWVVAQKNSYFGDRWVFKLDLTNQLNPLNFVTLIPEYASEFGRQNGGEILVAGYGDAPDAHPPLRVSLDGTLTRACE